MSRLTDLIRQAKEKDPTLGQDLEMEFAALSSRRQFGLNFERHQPEAVELPGRPPRKGDKVRILPPRGSAGPGDPRLWKVTGIESMEGTTVARLHIADDDGALVESADQAVEDIVVIAEFRDPIYPGLKRSDEPVLRGGDKPFHTVINAENYHALEALLFTHQGKVDCIYIDPPYNTRANDWKYNNNYVDPSDSYAHSKWLAFMERRLKLAKKLLSPSGILVVTIDEHEAHRLGILMEQLFPDFTHQTVTIVINPKGVTQDYLSRVDEYAMFAFGPTARVFYGADDLLTHRETTTSTDGRVRPRWKGLLRSGDDAARADREQMFYPVWIDPKCRKLVRAGEWLPLNQEPDLDAADGDLIAVWPIRKNLTLGRWGVGAQTLNDLIDSGYAKLGSFDKKRRTWGISYLSEQVRDDLDEGLAEVLDRDPSTGVADVAYVDVAARRTRTVWHRSSHDAGAHGSDLLSKLIPGRKFPFPKSLYAVEDTLRVAVGGKKDAIVLDFFAGSGTTAHAVMRLNREDGGHRRSISVTNNEVNDLESSFRTRGLRPGDLDWEAEGICERVTKPRIRAAVHGQNSQNEPIPGDYAFNNIFPIADGLEENVEFFNLTYESPWRVARGHAFDVVAPLLWMQAGSEGRRIDKIPEVGWDVADVYGVIADLDQTAPFLEAVKCSGRVRMVFIVTDDDRAFQSVCAVLPEQVEPVRLYESYLRNFEIKGRD